jgi:D-aminopeptidase
MMRLRARTYGISIGQMNQGPLNAITDVKGVGVGHSTLIQDDSIRTGVTAITPHNGNLYDSKVKGAVDILNAYGKSVGLEQIIFEGWIETPIMLTETLNTYRVADAVIDYYKENFETSPRSLNCIVGETNGGFLTDNLNRHIGIEQVFEAIDRARNPMEGRNVREGNHGGGTPMTGYGFKGGIGTSSRIIARAQYS